MSHPQHPAGVFLVGGAPLVGKTSAGHFIGRLLGMQVVSTDHLGEAARAVTTAASHPDLHACSCSDHGKYYTSFSPEELVGHAVRAHRALWPAVKAIIHRHLTWAGPVVIEGWALLPDLVAGIESANVQSVWIGAPESVLRSRLQNDSSFARGAVEPSLLVERFVGRSVRMQAWLRERADSCRLPYIALSGSEDPDQVSALCLDMLAAQRRPGL